MLNRFTRLIAFDSIYITNKINLSPIIYPGTTFNMLINCQTIIILMLSFYTRKLHNAAVSMSITDI